MGKHLSELELLLNNETFSFFNNTKKNEDLTYGTNNLQKAKGNASLLDFVDMVALIV